MMQLETSLGVIEYSLNRKRVKNLNLRIRTDCSIAVSAPLKMPQREIEAFLCSKAAWIIKHQEKLAKVSPPPACTYTKEQCLEIFTTVSDRIFPLFSDLLKGQKPLIKAREMKTRWGVCNIPKRTITLNTRLAEKPLAALEYVVLHEYVHFIHPNHQAGFHMEMERLMPDYKQRRKLLK